MENPVLPSSCVTPAGTSIEVQNEWEENTHTDQCEWHRMTRMTGPDCVVMCNLINTHTHTHTHMVEARSVNVKNTTTTDVVCWLPEFHGFKLAPLSFFFLNLTYSRWTSSLPSCLWSLGIFPSLPGSRLTIFYRDASSALLQLVHQWLNFTYSRSHAFRYERKNTNPTLVKIELTTSAQAGVRCRLPTRPLGRRGPFHYINGRRKLC